MEQYNVNQRNYSEGTGKLSGNSYRRQWLFAISLSTFVVVDTLPHILVNVLGSLQFCDGDSVVLEAQNADTYVWSNGANSQNCNQNSGSYDVTGTNSYGCKSVSPTYTSEKQN